MTPFLPPPADASPTMPDPRTRDLRRMRTIATALLVAMTAIFIATRIYEPHWHWLGFVRAFAEASMVGACADWFAVVALFRHPLGLPIPHTALIRRNKMRIANSAGDFISRNFLEPSVVAARLSSIDAVGWWARHLSVPENAAREARRAVGFLTPFVELAARPSIHVYPRDTLYRGLKSLPAAPLAGRVLAILLESGQLREIAERALEFGDQALSQHDTFLRAKVSEKSSWWIPKWVDDKLANRVLTGARTSLAELRAPDHPWRSHFDDTVRQLVDRLAHDPEMAAAGERLLHQILGNPAAGAWLDGLLREIETKTREDLAKSDGFIRTRLEEVLVSSAQLLADDSGLRETVNGWLRHLIEVAIVPHRAEIGTFISDVIKRWDDKTIVSKMELTFGTDLQYIRINGTLVGGLVGLTIYVVSEFAPLLGR